MRHVVISFLGEDRTGIVEQLAKVVKKHHGNWQTSSMRHLSGFFAGILEVEVSEEHAEALVYDLKALPNLQVQVQITEPRLFKDKKVSLAITANDRPGIIGDISAVINKVRGNLVKLVSSQGSAPHFGQAIFKASAIIAVQSDEQVDALIQALEDIEDDLIVDVNV